MPLDLCMVFISDGGVLTAWNNCKMSKSCYSSHPMRITVDISRWCIIYAMQSWSSSSNRYELYYSGMHIIWSEHWGLQYFRRSRHLDFFFKLKIVRSTWDVQISHNLCSVCVWLLCIYGDSLHISLLCVLSLTSSLLPLWIEFCFLFVCVVCPGLFGREEVVWPMVVLEK